jgi:hypothetical protein
MTGSRELRRSFHAFLVDYDWNEVHPEHSDLFTVRASSEELSCESCSLLLQLPSLSNLTLPWIMKTTLHAVQARAREVGRSVQIERFVPRSWRDQLELRWIEPGDTNPRIDDSLLR